MSTNTSPGAMGAGRSLQTWALVLACTATFMLIMDVTVINVALPVIRRDFSADLADQQWILAAYTLPLAAFLLAAGTLGDQLGRRRLFIVGLVIFTASSLMAGLAPGIEVLVLARTVQGVGGAILFAVSPALIAQEFPAAERSKAYGTFGAVTGLALAVGPIVGGVLASVDWRWIFLVNVPIGVVLLFATSLRARDVLSGARARLDLPGLITSALALAAVTFAIIRSESSNWTASEVWVPLAAGVVALFLFLLIELRSENPLLELDLLRNRTFAGLLVATFLSNAASLGGIFLVVSYVQNVLGHSALEAGLVLLPLTLVLFVVAAVTGQLLDRVAPGLLLGISIALIAGGLALLALADADAGWTRLLPGLVTMGMGMGMFNPPRSVVTVGVVPAQKAGLASGIGEAFQQVGVVFGIAVVGAFFQHRVIDAAPDRTTGQIAASGDFGALPAGLVESARHWFTSGFSAAMLMAGVVCAVGSVIAFSTIRKSDMHDEAKVALEEVQV